MDGNLRVTGDVSVTGNGNAVYVEGGNTEIKGAVNGKANKGNPVIALIDGKLRVIGDVSVASDAVAVYEKGGKHKN